MKLLIGLILGLCVLQVHGQQISIGLVGGIESLTPMRIVTPTIGIEAHGKYNEKTLSPEIGFLYRWNDLFSTGIGIGYRTQTLSVSVWNPQADTCRLCPLIKGGGPSVRELRLSPESSVVLARGRSWQFSIGFGIIWAIRFDIRSNVGEHTQYFKEEFNALSQSYRYMPIYTQAGFGFTSKNIGVQFRYEHTGAYMRYVNLPGRLQPARMEETRFLLHLTYRIGVGNGETIL